MSDDSDLDWASVHECPLTVNRPVWVPPSGGPAGPADADELIVAAAIHDYRPGRACESCSPA